jgi:hypothetical protein
VAIGQVARYAECVGATKAFQLKSATLAITAMKRVRRTALEVKATRLSALRCPASHALSRYSVATAHPFSCRYCGSFSTLLR